MLIVQKNIQYLLLLLPVLLILTTLGCGDDDDNCSVIEITCPQFNACEFIRQKPANASFAHIDTVTLGGRIYPCNFSVELNEIDTSNWGLHTFRANYELTNVNSALVEYEWKFGSDPNIREGRIVELFFEENIASSVDVRLVTTVNPVNCQNLGVTSDTAVQTVYFNTDFSTKMVGQYRGRNDGETEDRLIEIGPFSNGGQFGLNNLFDNCPQTTGTTLFVSLNYKHLTIPGSRSDGCKSACGGGKLSPDGNMLTIDYSTRDAAGLESAHRFTGIRIP